jgi:hypothetical protein
MRPLPWEGLSSTRAVVTAQGMLPDSQGVVLHRLETAHTEDEQIAAAEYFLMWARAEGLLESA